MADERHRKLVHAAGSVFPLLYLAGFATWPQLKAIYVAGTAVAVCLEVLRLVVGVEWAVFQRLTREYEQGNPAGYALYTVGSAIAVVAFDPRVAVPAVLMLTIADPISGAVGDDRLRAVKRPVVLGVMFGVCLALGLAFVPAGVAAMGALAATIADGVKPVVGGYVVDDNFSIPVGASLAMWVGLRLAGM